jgi:hypothetical protein
MKLDTIQRVFKRQPRVKLFVVTENFCLCGYATKPRATDQGLLVQIGPSVRFSFVSKQLRREARASGTLHLTATCKVTRRIETHRRHLEDLGVPGDYVNQAEAL